MTKPARSVARDKGAVHRVNARLDSEHAKKLETLVRTTGGSVSDVIRDAIDQYHAAKATMTPKGRAALDRLAGIAEGPGDLSTRYKEYLSERLAKKHGYR